MLLYLNTFDKFIKILKTIQLLEIYSKKIMLLDFLRKINIVANIINPQQNEIRIITRFIPIKTLIKFFKKAHGNYV